jgi:hypothetical protein
MSLLQQLAEARIREAIEAGELDDLEGQGQPLELDDDRMVPEALRAGYRLLKNAGYLPPELVLRREIASARELLAAARCDGERGRAERRLDVLLLRLAHSRGRGFGASVEIYRDRILRQLDQAAVPEASGEPGSGNATPNSPAR